ncbi:MAG: hypothetical protein GPJ54_19845 [Candidatus Heimdallarchaeota archaeon]|nr:hypothetical protein [Candidatus Heimdallarchaeota archaeon]
MTFNQNQVQKTQKAKGTIVLSKKLEDVEPFDFLNRFEDQIFAERMKSFRRENGVHLEQGKMNPLASDFINKKNPNLTYTKGEIELKNQVFTARIIEWDQDDQFILGKQIVVYIIVLYLIAILFGALASIGLPFSGIQFLTYIGFISYVVYTHRKQFLDRREIFRSKVTRALIRTEGSYANAQNVRASPKFILHKISQECPYKGHTFHHELPKNISFSDAIICIECGNSVLLQYTKDETGEFQVILGGVRTSKISRSHEETLNQFREFLLLQLDMSTSNEFLLEDLRQNWMYKIKENFGFSDLIHLLQETHQEFDDIKIKIDTKGTSDKYDDLVFVYNINVQETNSSRITKFESPTELENRNINTQVITDINTNLNYRIQPTGVPENQEEQEIISTLHESLDGSDDINKYKSSNDEEITKKDVVQSSSETIDQLRKRLDEEEVNN